MTLMLFEFGLEPFQQGECVGGRTRKAGENGVLVKLAYLSCGRFDDDITQGNLAVAAQCDLIVASYTNDGSTVKLIHSRSGLVAVQLLTHFAPLLCFERQRCGRSR